MRIASQNLPPQTIARDQSFLALRSPVPDRRPRSARGGYLLTEALVYIGCLFVILGVGYMAVERCMDHSVVMRRNAEDVARALEAGERWRADVRAAIGPLRLALADSEQVVSIPAAKGEIAYRFSDSAVSRRVGANPWITVLANVKASVMQAEPRGNVRAWRWELELQPRAKASVRAARVRPLFTFLAVPAASSTP